MQGVAPALFPAAVQEHGLVEVQVVELLPSVFLSWIF